MRKFCFLLAAVLCSPVLAVADCSQGNCAVVAYPAGTTVYMIPAPVPAYTVATPPVYQPYPIVRGTTYYGANTFYGPVPRKVKLKYR